MQKRRILEGKPGMRVLVRWVQAPLQLPLYPGQEGILVRTGLSFRDPGSQALLLGSGCRLRILRQPTACPASPPNFSLPRIYVRDCLAGESTLAPNSIPGKSEPG